MTTLYQEHRNRWTECNKCELCSQRNHVVLARGMVPSPILFIGEAPGQSEDVLGKPFVGPAGKLLDRIIDQAIDGQHNYALTNLVACFPRDAKEEGTHEPPKEAIEACIPRLREFVRMCKPQLIVLVGRLAAKHIVDQDQFGPPWSSTPLRFCEIIHPASILRADVSQRGLAIQRSIVILDDAVSEL